MSEDRLELRRKGWKTWISTESLKMISALPLIVPDQDLKRSRVRLSLALSHLPDDSPIYDCLPESVIGCMVMSAMTGLFPGGHNPDVWLIPRQSKKHDYRLVLNWQISYRGHIRLCRRTPGWDVQAVPVYTPDVFTRSRSSSGSEYHHEPVYEASGTGDADWEALRGCLILVRSPTGEKWDFLSKGAIQKRRDKAQDPANWNEWPIERAMGTSCAYAGQREMWPTDDPARYALGMEAAQLGDSISSSQSRPSLLPSDALAGVAKSMPQADLRPVTLDHELTLDDAEALEAFKATVQAEVAAEAAGESQEVSP